MTKTEYIEFTDKTISELVYDKQELQKAYNYYDGILDEDQYKYLEDEYGIGNPTSVTFVPLIKKHVDALVGEVLETPILPKVTCKDSETLSKITREKELYISQEVLQFLNKRLQNKIIQYFQDGDKIVDTGIQEAVDNLKEDLDTSFISEYEVAAQNVIEYILQSREIDIKEKLRQLCLDILISGQDYYRAFPSTANNNVQVETLDPRNVFVERNPNSIYIKDGRRAVVRKWMSKQDIIAIYGKKLSESDIQGLDDLWGNLHNTVNTSIVVAVGSNQKIPIDARSHKQHINAGYPITERGDEINDLIPVYEVEWIETDQKTYIQYRYKTVRIGENIYVIQGKDDTAVRSQSHPEKCSLSINGVQYTTRNGQPYSMVLACASLQDKYNLLCFYRDNLIASSGTVGDIVDISMLPKLLGANTPERLKKWVAYKKAGMALIDSSQEGRQELGIAAPNQIYNGFDDTVKVQSIQAIQLAIQSIEETVSSITGVFRERLNGIQQKDAVTNVQTSVNNSFIVTKGFTQQVDQTIIELLLDSLNVAKVVFKNGLIGTLILGDKQTRVFTALPEYFTLTDYDIHIVTNSDITRQLEQLKQIVPEFVKAQIVPPDLIIEALTCTSLTDYKLKLRKAIKKQHQENSQIQQLQQQLQQMQQELKQTQQELQKAQTKVQQLNEAKLQIESEKNKATIELEWFKARTDRAYKEKLQEEQSKRTDIEVAQLHDGNPYNDRIKQVVGV